MQRPDLIHQLEAASQARARAGLRRRLRAAVGLGPGRCVIDGRAYRVFSSNDYLGLAGHPKVGAALRCGVDAYGVGSTGAHLISGHHREHALLEEALADWTGRESALLFATGSMANLGVMQALLGRSGRRGAVLCVQDKLNHASLIDGAHASGAILRRYPHADAEAAARQLDSAPGAAALLATDGVFSMDGDIAPLAALAGLCRRRGATLMVDDAHGLGVLGPQGAGSVAASGLAPDDVPVLMGTLGKALGTAGAFVAGPAVLVEGLVQFARSFVYTTAPPPALAAATRAALRLVRAGEGEDRRETLRAHIARFRQGARQLGLPLLPSSTPIQPLLTERAGAVADALEGEGLLVGAIRPPSVPPGRSRLRITLSAAHAPDDVDRLLDALRQYLGHAT